MIVGQVQPVVSVLLAVGVVEWAVMVVPVRRVQQLVGAAMEVLEEVAVIVQEAVRLKALTYIMNHKPPTKTVFSTIFYRGPGHIIANEKKAVHSLV